MTPDPTTPASDSDSDRGTDTDTNTEAETVGVTDVPATPNEQMHLAIQMDDIQTYTVRPGLMRLPVSSLDTAPNSEQYVLQLDHPFIDDQDTRFFIPKPVYWDPTEFLWPRFLGWYGYTSRSQYELQTDRVYVRYNAQADDWTLTKPPSATRKRLRRLANAIGYRTPSVVARPARALRRWAARTRRQVSPTTPAARAGLVLGLGVVSFLGYAALGFRGAGVGSGVIVEVLMYATLAWLVTTILSALLFAPPHREG